MFSKDVVRYDYNLKYMNCDKLTDVTLSCIIFYAGFHTYTPNKKIQLKF